LDCDTYWESKYEIRRDQVPPFLEELENDLLLAGRYTNVARECSRGLKVNKARSLAHQSSLDDFPPTPPAEDEEEVLPGSRALGNNSGLPGVDDELDEPEDVAGVVELYYVRPVRDAYVAASTKLLELLLAEGNLLARLR
jgi:hypothetical protein